MIFFTMPVLLFYHLSKSSLPPNNYKNQKHLRMKKLFTSYNKWRKQTLNSDKYSLLFILMITSAISFGQVAPVNPPNNGFYINGKLKADSADVGDWVDGTGTGGYVLQLAGAPLAWGPINSTTTKFVRDSFDNTADRIFSGSSFGDNPNDWKWTTGKATAKCDINNALFHSTTSTTQKWLILGGDRFAQTGTSYIDFQFSQGIFTRTATGFSSLAADGVTSLAATNGRTVGDFVLSMEYTAGGAVATVHYYRWEASGSTYKFVEKPIPAPGGVASAFGASNTAATNVPFGAFGSTSYAPFAFVEAAVNIGAILTGSCQSVNIKTIFVSTKASDSYSAALKDFVDPQAVDFVFGNAGLSYSSPSFCKNDANPAPTVPSPIAGTFAGSNGLSINSGTGVINLAATDAGTYTATYTPTGGVCLTPATAVITVVANPVALALTGSTICTSVTGTGTITSTTSVTGVSYQLYNSSDAPIQSSKAGNGSGLTWSNVAAGTGYYAIATGSAPTNCTSASSNAVSVVEVANPVALVLTGSSLCTSAGNTGTITSGTSVSGVSYQLYNSSNTPVQAAKPGTGSGLSWTLLTPGNGYYAIGTGAAPTTCTSTSNSVNVTAVNNPTALSLTGSSICSSGGNIGTITSTTSQSGVIYQLYTSSDAPVQSSQAGTGSGLTWSLLAPGNGYYVRGTGAAPTSCTSTSNSVNVAVVGNPAKPTVTITEPTLCGSPTGTLTVTNPVVGATYTVTQSAGGFNPTPVVYASGTLSFTGLKPGFGFSVVATVGTCSSATTDCDHLGSVVNRSTTVQFEGPAESQTTVKAYPNPFSDRIKFMVTSTVAGNGNLEIYNMMGQKVKTVYQGYIAAGTQTFELNLPGKQVANLVYVLRVGDKKMTGKILQVNQ